MIGLHIVSIPFRGKGSGEFWPNPWFLFCGAHRQGHAKLRSDWSVQERIIPPCAVRTTIIMRSWSVWLCGWLAVKQSLDMIGQHDCMGNLSYTASVIMLHSYSKLVIWLCQRLACENSSMQAQGIIQPKFTRPSSSWEVGSGDETKLRIILLYCIMRIWTAIP